MTTTTAPPPAGSAGSAAGPTASPTELAVDPEALRAVRRALLRQQLALDPLRPPPPDTGSTSVLSAQAFDRVTTAVATLAADLQALADAVERFLDDVATRDDQVSTRLGRLRTGAQP